MYHHLYVQSNTLFLASVFKIFCNKCIEIYELYPAYFLLAPGLTWKEHLKKIKVELELLTDVDMQLMVEKKSVVEYVTQSIDMPRRIRNTLKTMIEVKFQIFYVLGCEQSLLMKNVTKIAC